MIHEELKILPATIVKQIIYDFANPINEHNVGKICSLMIEDRKFIDAHGNEVIGKDKMKAGWVGYFSMVP